MDILDLERKILEALDERRTALEQYRNAVTGHAKAKSAYSKAYALGIYEHKNLTPEAVRKALVEAETFELYQEELVLEALKVSLGRTLEVVGTELDAYRSLMSLAKEEAKLTWVSEGT